MPILKEQPKVRKVILLVLLGLNALMQLVGGAMMDVSPE